MKEKPIIFSGEMVRAILDGRKTQTRRPVKCIHDINRIATPEEWNAGRAHPNMRRFEEWGSRDSCFLFQSTTGTIFAMPSPYKLGDHLWMRETWARTLDHSKEIEVYYKATDQSTWEGGWLSPLFMPKWAARLWLHVIDISVERLQNISDHDAICEGFRGWYGPLHPNEGSTDGRLPHEEFKEYWDTIYKKKPEFQWQANPWVWVYEFRVTPKEVGR